MGLTPIRTTIAGAIPVFQKVIELFKGGFHLNRPVGFVDGIDLPAGTLLKVDESTRVAIPIKVAVTTQTAASDTAIYVETGHPFVASDIIAVNGHSTAGKIISVKTTTASGDKIAVNTVFTTTSSCTGERTVYHTATAGTTLTLHTIPNGILAYDSTLSTGEEASVLLRGTVYKNRANPLQPHLIDAHFAGLDHIYVSESS